MPEGLESGHSESWFWRWGMPLLVALVTVVFYLTMLLAVIVASKNGAFDGV